MNYENGRYYTTLEADMRAFDELPPAARRALADSIRGNYAAQPLLRGYRRGRYSTGDEIARLVHFFDQRELEKREKQRALAIGPYSGNAPDPGNRSRAARNPIAKA